MAIPSTTPTAFSLTTLEQALVAGTGVVSAGALTGQFGTISVIAKVVATLVLAVDAALGYKHIAGTSAT